jgi:hypothetical protein
MVTSMTTPFATRASYRRPLDQVKTYVEAPSFEEIESLLDGIDRGEVECVTMYGPHDERLFIIGKPGFYHLTMFIDETDGYAFSDGSGDNSKIEIAGDYWPSFRVCKEKSKLVEASREFYKSGSRPVGQTWLEFSED